MARALEKDPDARYPDAAAMAADLRIALAEPGAASAVAPAAVLASEYASTVVQQAPASEERTQALGSATLAAPVAALHVSARFDSAPALMRLTEPRGRDRQLMSPSAESPSFAQAWLADPSAWGGVALIAAAAALAWWVS